MDFTFTKMHGLGNDFVIIDSRANPSSHLLPLEEAQIRLVCDRHLGIGCDQLVLLDFPATDRTEQEQHHPEADSLVRFFNPDGSEAEACGNASRCVAALLGGNPVLQTRNGLLPTRQNGTMIEVNMGIPRLHWQDIPLSRPMETLHLPVHDAAACSMGNPHATLFCSVEQAALLGPELETHPLFPQRANIGFAEILTRQHMRLRVWERGAGLTLACGSGACAAMVNAARRGLIDRHCRVSMEEGDLLITWQEGENGAVLMSGPAIKVFEGRFCQ